ncbi:dihydroxyacetone kinase ADP-binding subunit DhaL [Photobacterium sp. SDRW27]|uniref:dihydroxyacetone kinase subunit DhaL n=1 Tax=Photobacterium obscurum TaxID=2829490 RepID=UPI002244584E|nr:dihydroxyacetone kinase subunit DhaL [Photobacterium obscurum]MCW8331425.1 dihydroxyacetone kinase ADP-binding subunit DhaL [Photobacterium obscurum]
MNSVSKQQLVQWLEIAADKFEAEKDYLTELDRQIGDADHGINMNRGFHKVREKLPDFIDKDIGTIMKSTGMALLSSIGGASGPLYGTFFIRSAASATAKDELDLAELATMLQDGLDGVQQRGKAEANDKTMVDTWLAILDSLNSNQDKPLLEALGEALQAGEQGMKKTIDMQARKGRASYLGERSIGHQDPGATSSYFLFEALCKAAIP